MYEDIILIRCGISIGLNSKLHCCYFNTSFSNSSYEASAKQKKKLLNFLKINNNKCDIFYIKKKLFPIFLFLIII